MANLKTFEVHGWVQRGTSGDEVYGDCPFSGKDGKLYINKNTLAWHSKTANVGGGPSKFLELRCKQNSLELTGRPLRVLVADRGLPAEAFKSVGVGFDGAWYTIPSLDEKGRIADVRRWRPGFKMIATTGCQANLWGMNELANANPDVPVYLCEGEWDGIALRWLMSRLKKKPKGVVVAVPGASTFKQPWIEMFRGRVVHTIYDNDAAGEEGEIRVRELLTGIARRITYTHWLSKLPDRFDLRDWIVNGAVERKIPNRCWNTLQSLFRSNPRRSDPLDDETEAPPESAPTRYEKPATLEQVYSVFNKWLLLRNNDFIKVALGVVISQEIPGDPVWMFLVGPPGSAKSEMCTSLTRDEKIFSASSVTPHSLISGANTPRDPSLIPKLNGRVLVIKDFTSILSMGDHDRSEIFGILRDAYDGYCGKVFGNGVSRHYDSRFTVLAGVTPQIYAMSSQNQALGERFLKFAMGDNLHHFAEDEVVGRAIQNVSTENAMRDEMQDVVASFLSGLRKRLGERKPVILSSHVADKLVSLAKYCARLRGVVDRDGFRPDQMLSKPSAEIATRLAKQLTKLAMSVAVVLDQDSVGEEEYLLVRKVAIDTVSQRREDLVRCLWKECPDDADAMRTREIVAKTRYPVATVNRMLDDLTSLDIVQREGRSNAYEWSLTPYVRDLIRKSGVYDDAESVYVERNELATSQMIRRRKKVKLRRRLQRT